MGRSSCITARWRPTPRASRLLASIRFKGRGGTDFGPGFYTTTLEAQAKSWAWLLAAQSAVGGVVPPAAVVRLEVDRDALSRLDSIAFIRGDYDAEDYWSLVFHCRGGALDHARPPAAPYYDVAYGPVAAFWTQRSAMHGADQISFHSSACTPILDVKGVDPV